MPRRRPRHDSAEGHDSFLDIVANLVGILIILVMVVTVRARDAAVVEEMSDQPVATPVDVDSARSEVVAITSDIHRLDDLLRRQTLEVAFRAREREKVLERITRAEQALALQEEELDTQKQEQLASDLATRQLRQQLDQLNESRERIQQMQPESRIIEHRPTPLAKTVFGVEVHFRLSQGRIAYVPWEQLLNALKADAQRQVERLSDRDSLTEQLGPIGGFRMRYRLSRMRRLVNTPEGNRLRQVVELERFELLPIDENMGEPLEDALREGSRFRQTLASYPSNRATITIWTYPDSFLEFQRLKTLLHKQGWACAGRPLPDGMLISGSPNGVNSAAQ